MPNGKEDCLECCFHIKASDGCTRLAHGLKCEKGVNEVPATEAEDEAFRQLSATAELRSALEKQVGGTHYKGLGAYQPWLVLQAWLTAEEFRGYMKGTALVYLAREREKGGDLDIEKAAHTLEAQLELLCKAALSR